MQDSNKSGCGTNINSEIVDGPELLGFTEDSLDGCPPSFGSDLISSPAPSTTLPTATTSTRKKDKDGTGRKSKLVTGYILYSSEVRKERSQCNPDFKFGDISRLVGIEWRSLCPTEKQIWEDRAKKVNEETQAALAEEAANRPIGCPSPAPGATPFSILSSEPLPNQVRVLH